MQRYTISCNCGAKRDVIILQSGGREVIDWLDNKTEEHIISGRKRLDGNWGWQCLCGNNDLETEQERTQIEDLATPKPFEITNILDKLVKQKPKFRMELA